MKFKVLMKAEIEKYIEIEADSFEAAVASAYEAEYAATVHLKPTWIDKSEVFESTGALSYEVVGICNRCNVGLIDRGDVPWTWSPGPDDMRLLVCYDCLVKHSKTKTRELFMALKEKICNLLPDIRTAILLGEFGERSYLNIESQLKKENSITITWSNMNGLGLFDLTGVDKNIELGNNPDYRYYDSQTDLLVNKVCEIIGNK